MEIRIYGFFSGFTFPCRKNGRRHLGISVPIHSSRKLSPITRASLSGYDTLIHRTPGKRKKTDRSANLHIGPRIHSERYPLLFRIGNRDRGLFRRMKPRAARSSRARMREVRILVMNVCARGFVRKNAARECVRQQIPLKKFVSKIRPYRKSFTLFYSSQEEVVPRIGLSVRKRKHLC